MGTRSSNSSKHPGLVTKTATRRSSAQVKAAAMVKEAAKKAKKDAEVARIHRVAKFEYDEKIAEDMAVATPRPNFTPGELMCGIVNLDSDELSLAPHRESSDSDNPIPRPTKKLPMRKKKAAKKKNEDSESSDEIILYSVDPGFPKRLILEETDSDGHGPPAMSWRPRPKRLFNTDDDDTTEEKNIPSAPTSKKAKRVDERDANEKQHDTKGKEKQHDTKEKAKQHDTKEKEKQHDTKEKKKQTKKPTVREAIASVIQMGTSGNTKNEGEGEDKGEDVAVQEEGQSDQIGLWAGDHATYVILNSFLLLPSCLLSMQQHFFIGH